LIDYLFSSFGSSGGSAKSAGSSKATPVKDKKMSAQLAKWNQKHSELDDADFQPSAQPTQPKPKQRPAVPPPASSDVGGWVDLNAAPSEPATTSTPVPQAPLEITKGLLCLICRRQFKSEAQLEKHCQESKLHQDNLAVLKASSASTQTTESSTEPTVRKPLNNN